MEKEERLLSLDHSVDSLSTSLEHPLSRLLRPSRQQLVKKIRDITRLLTHKSKELDNESKDTLQNKIQLLQQQLSLITSHKNKPSCTLGKQKLYNKLKFFELKKIKRRLRQCRSKLLLMINSPSLHSPEEIQFTRDELSALQDNLLYIEEYPMNQPYISLFPNVSKLDKESQALLENKKERIKDQIKTKIKLKRVKAASSLIKKKSALVDTFFSTQPPGPTPSSEPVSHYATNQDIQDAKSNNSLPCSNHILFDDD